MLRTIEFDTILVIQSLPSDEKQTGTELHNDLLQRRSAQIPFLKTGLAEIANAAQFRKALEQIAILTWRGRMRPFLHFEIHGAIDGLKLSSGELITWQEFAGLLRAINIPLRNGLFVSMAVCYSGYLYGEIRPDLPSPFFAFTGCWKEIYQFEIIEDFYTFFDTLLEPSNIRNIDFANAIHMLNRHYDPPKFGFYSSELVFDMLMKEHAKNLEDPTTLDHRVKNIISMLYNNPKYPDTFTESQLQTMIREGLLSGKLEADQRKVFLMQD